LALGSLDGSAVLGLLCALIIALAYGTVAGLRGVVWTDLLQFSLAMIGAIALAWMAYQAVGSVEAVASLLTQNQAGMLTSDLQIISALAPMDPTWLDHLSPQHPSLDLIGAHGDLVLTALLLSWWANKNADGGGVLVQRMLACRSPKDATLAMGWFTAAHYMIRPWAWVATGLVVGLLFSIPPATGFEQSYPDAMLSWLPNGVLGLALGGLVAALISTADTHLHWGASYLANDLLPTHASDQQRLRASRWSQPIMALIAAVIAVHLNSIAAAWKILLVLGAGLGAPTLLRWFMMRIDARSELVAFGASTVAAGLVLWGPWDRPSFAWQMAIVGSTGLIGCLLCTIRTTQDQQAAKDFMRRTNNTPKSWWIFALAALGSMLLAAAGASQALVGQGLGFALLTIGLISYALILRAYAQRIGQNQS
jgi:Na+/proline symporter